MKLIDIGNEYEQESEHDDGGKSGEKHGGGLVWRLAVVERCVCLRGAEERLILGNPRPPMLHLHYQLTGYYVLLHLARALRLSRDLSGIWARMVRRRHLCR